MSTFEFQRSGEDLDSFASRLVHHTNDSAAGTFVRPQRTPRQHWISSEAWQFIQTHAPMRRMMNLAAKLQRLIMTALIFTSWNASYLTPYQWDGALLGYYACAKTCAWYRFGFNKSKWAVRQILERDRQAYVDRIVADAEKASWHGDQRTLYQITRRLSQFKPASFRSVRLENGAC